MIFVLHFYILYEGDFSEERAKMQEELKTEEFDRKAHREIEKEEIQVAADHASKMAAKWEKINQKEARKAEKSKMPTKST